VAAVEIASRVAFLISGVITPETTPETTHPVTVFSVSGRGKGKAVF